MEGGGPPRKVGTGVWMCTDKTAYGPANRGPAAPQNGGKGAAQPPPARPGPYCRVSFDP